MRLRRGPIVLMYHALGEPSELPSRYVLPARRFAQHMAWLRGHHYPIVSLTALRNALQQRGSLSARAVAITIDHAYADLYAWGLPILRRYAIPASVFVVSGRVGQRNDWEWDRGLAQRPMATWRELSELRAAGIEIGAHSRTHRSLTRLTEAEVQDEIVGSRSDIAATLQCDARTLAYPHGHSSPGVRNVARAAGFWAACGVRPEPCTYGADLFDLPRVEMQGTWRLTHLALALWLGHVPAALAQ